MPMCFNKPRSLCSPLAAEAGPSRNCKGLRSDTAQTSYESVSAEVWPGVHFITGAIVWYLLFSREAQVQNWLHGFSESKQSFYDSSQTPKCLWNSNLVPTFLKMEISIFLFEKAKVNPGESEKCRPVSIALISSDRFPFSSTQKG